jgi:2-(1,2-epoxy-1,2-dihydrophenyl)acetyl-CoA isomerase
MKARTGQDMTYQTIKLDITDGIATLTLDRPAKKNALDLSIRDEIADALVRVRENDAVRALVLTGAGENFCSGGDLRSMATTEITAEAGQRRMRAIHGWLRELIEFDRPVIAAVDGVAYGAGFSLALTADFVLATPRARFCASFQRVGLVPDSGILYTLPRVVGLQRAKALLFSAREIDAATAENWGIVFEIVPAESLAARARSIATGFVNASGTALALTKATLNRSFESDLSAMLEFEAAAQGVAFTTDYHRAAVRRFLDKQPTLFQWPSSTVAK